MEISLPLRVPSDALRFDRRQRNRPNKASALDSSRLGGGDAASHSPGDQAGRVGSLGPVDEDDATVVAYIGMVHCAIEAAKELAKDSISVEIVDPRTLHPMDEQTIVASVRKTHRAVVVESGAGFAGLDSEIAAFIAEQAFDDLDAPVERVTGADAPMPYAKNLGQLKAPTQEKIVAAVRRVCYAPRR